MARALVAITILSCLAACSADDGEQPLPDKAPVAPPASAGTGTSGLAGSLGGITTPPNIVPPSPGLAGAPAPNAAAGRGAVPPTTPPPTTPPVTPPPAGMAGAPAPTTPPPMTSGADPVIPMAPADCPEIKTGNITVLGQSVTLWVGEKQEGKKGPIVFYWHGTGSSPMEASGGLGPGNREVMAEGGVIASFSTTTKKGMNTGNNVWYTGDFEMADQILACAVKQLNIDTRRIYTAGCSAGGLQASAMVYGRSTYLAAAMPNSGGTVFSYQLQDKNHIPALITAHGKMGSDVVGIDFSTTSNTQCKDMAAKGGLAVDCDHGGGHCRSPAELKAAQWQFLKDNPFGVTPRPYANGLPPSFPMYCKKF